MLCHNRFFPPEPQRHHRDISDRFIPHRERRLFGLDRVKLRFALKGTDSSSGNTGYQIFSNIREGRNSAPKYENNPPKYIIPTTRD
jgi:hypothetical protein